ncbi:MAG TPA: tRNA pseudouridine(38-40) synthase TruA [Sorangium sp.]|nr:tRNA pseudouridine(38-40) synthase TruA [Sorangium sp.]
MAARSTILLSVAYDGAGYSGAASQQNAVTIADTLRRALAKLDPAVSPLRLASRTDAGVHARDQRVAFDSHIALPMRAWVLGVIPHLPDDVVVLSAARVPPGFTPRFAAVGKHYRYLLCGSRMRDPFLRQRVWRVPDIHHARASIDAALQQARGRHDFSGFAAAADPRDNKQCTLSALSCSALPHHPKLLAIDIYGDRFVYNMVRILVGTAVDVGRKKVNPDAVAHTLASGNRRDGGVTAPAHGLYLQRVDLDVNAQSQWPPADTDEPAAPLFGGPSPH